MYIKGITDYDREGKPRETGLFAGVCTQDGEIRQTKNGKTYGSVSVRAFNRKDGTAAFMTVKSFDTDTAASLSAFRKGDHLLAAGVVESREYNGRQYTDMMVDFLLTNTPASPETARAALTERVNNAFPQSGGADFVDLGENEELPF